MFAQLLLSPHDERHEFRLIRCRRRRGRRREVARLLRARVEVTTRVPCRVAAGRFHGIVDALETFHRLVPDGALRDDPRDRFDRCLSLDEAAVGND